MMDALMAELNSKSNTCTRRPRQPVRKRTRDDQQEASTKALEDAAVMGKILEEVDTMPLDDLFDGLDFDFPESPTANTSPMRKTVLAQPQPVQSASRRDPAGNQLLRQRLLRKRLLLSAPAASQPRKRTVTTKTRQAFDEQITPTELNACHGDLQTVLKCGINERQVAAVGRVMSCLQMDEVSLMCLPDDQRDLVVKIRAGALRSRRRAALLLMQNNPELP